MDLSLSDQLKLCGPIQESALDFRVSELLTDDLQWNKSRIDKFVLDFSAQIQCLKPSKEGAEDIFVWLPLKSGVYSTRSGYNSQAQSKSFLSPHTAHLHSSADL